MISEQCFSKEWIEEKTNGQLNLSEIVEKVIYAFHLLELLVTQNIDFVFKGGSSLLLHFDEFHRFSIDIDILTSEDNYTKLQEYIATFTDSRFVGVLEDIRKPHLIRKHHYKFTYKSNLLTNSNKDPYILLDIVVADNPYLNLVEKQIKFEFIKNMPPMLTVKIPTIEEMLGDKLTAFAPNTIGIRYVDMKFTEIIKQLYDCSKLFRVSNDFDLVYQTYLEISKREIAYRALIDLEVTDCIDDSLDTCKLILSDGKYGDPSKFQLLKRGIQGFSNFVVGHFSINEAILCSMDIYRCCILLKCGSEYEFRNLLQGYTAKIVKAAFLNSAQIKRLKIVSGPIFDDFLEAVWVENHFLKL